MPQKLDSFHSENEPYGLSYSVATGLWYDDEKEILPEPEITDLSEGKFSLTPILTEKDLDLINFNNEYCDSCAEDIQETMLWLRGEIDDPDIPVNISILALSDDIRNVFFYQFEEFPYFTDFISKVMNNQRAIFYSDCFSSIKLFSFPKENNLIHFITQAYNPYDPEQLNNWKPKILINTLINKDKFVSLFKDSLSKIYHYILDYIDVYGKENELTVSEINVMKDRLYRLAKYGYTANLYNEMFPK